MSENIVKIVCSVIPGFENIALKECKERLELDAHRDVRGRIKFDIDFEKVNELLNLRSVHHYWVIVGDKEKFCNAEQSKEEIFEVFCNLPNELDWSKALKTWKKFNAVKQLKDFKNIKNKEHNDEKGEQIDFNGIAPETDGEKIRFRCSANRTGEHIFTSMECARHIGGGVQDLFNWTVDLSHYDLEVVAYVVEDFVSVGIQLTKESQSLRNVTHFGPTTLKANICYCLIHLALAEAGDVICDPMCGGCSIPIEGAYSYHNLFHLGGDNHETAIEHSGENMESMIDQKKEEKGQSNCTINMSIVRWDVYHLPLRDGCVDHIVTDLPFGKKIGNKERNLFLYPIALGEMARICRAQGKAILLTQHKKAMKKALDRQWNWWRLLECRMINMGGMKVFVYILIRTKNEYVKKEFSLKTLTLKQGDGTDEKTDRDVQELNQGTELVPE